MSLSDEHVEEADDALVRRAEVLFGKRFGRPPRWIVAAPGRVNLIGEHVDYNDGYVLPMAIERHVVIAADRPQASDEDAESKISLFSTALRETADFAPHDDTPSEQPTWHDYVRGVVAECRAAGLEAGPLDVVIDSSVPLGGGLSSSAALEVATATLLEAVSGDTLDPLAKALLCQQAEHRFAGVPCGIMDQFSITFGQRDHLMLLDCRTRQIEQVPMSDGDISVLVINSNVHHELTGGEYAERRRQCEVAASRLKVESLRDVSPAALAAAEDRLDATHLRRARHVVSEIARTAAAAEEVAAGDWVSAGRRMLESHVSLRDDYEVSCSELDLLVDLASRNLGQGIFGSRMTGGGFGGCTVTLAEARRVDELATAIARDYERETGITPSWFTTRPAAGTRILRESG
ncbi:MAG: galactokinase [Planctomycetota bacterium]|nr:MAG: galactokinase [Planctomycetota bacterium]REJ95042.1 MAG: galactokinase [Planctomycetota bacterium]